MTHVIETLRNAFRSDDLRKRLYFTIGMIILFRVGGSIPVPGIDRELFSGLIDRFGQIGTMMNIISGGALKAASIFAMGITPYVNASIIMQLMTVVLPSLQNLQKEGETGRKKIQQYVRYLTVILGLIQAIAFWYATRSAASDVLPSVLNAFVVILSFTAGTAVIMWIGEQINEWGIGNGISLLIFAGILSRVPYMAQGLYQYFQAWAVQYNFYLAIVFAVIAVIAFVAMIVFVTYVSLAERRIPITYAKRMVGRKQYGGQTTYLPLKVNQSGVIPIIFALSLLSLPNMLVSFFFSTADNWFVNWFRNPGSSPIYYVVEALLIIGFAFFYTTIQFNPVEIGNNLQKNGGFIPGIRPGKPTIEFIGRTSRRICWFDGCFQAIVTLLPLVLGSATQTAAIWFGGTSVLIMVGVAIDFMNRIESHMMNMGYSQAGFLNRRRG